MEIRRKAITILATAGFLALLAAPGLSEPTGSGSRQAHHPQATEGKSPAVGGCTEQSPMMGGMKSGVMNGMTGSGMMGSGMMGSGMMSGTGPAGNSPSDRGMEHSAGNGCANAGSAS